MTITRYCIRCGTQFETDRKNIHLCSNKCIDEEFGNVMSPVCFYCNKIVSSPYHIVNNMGKYCKCCILCHFTKLQSDMRAKEKYIENYKNVIDLAEKERKNYADEIEKFKKQYEKELVMLKL